MPEVAPTGLEQLAVITFIPITAPFRYVTAHVVYAQGISTLVSYGGILSLLFPETLSSYYIGKYEVTQQLWEYVMCYSGKVSDGTTISAIGETPWLGDDLIPDSSYGLGDNYPAYFVSFDHIANHFLLRFRHPHHN